MKYPIFFFIITAALIYNLIDGMNFLLIYPILTGILLFLAYLTNRPNLIIGKNENGAYNKPLMLFSLPWLLITYTVWFITNYLSRENKVDKITDSIDIGCYPFNVNHRKYDLIIDLTSEFPRAYKLDAPYLCLPNLDGINLKNIEIPVNATRDSKILIHCAQGHGRSATYCSILMVKLGIVKNGLDALNIILKNRPGAKPSRIQYEQIKRAQQLDTSETMT